MPIDYGIQVPQVQPTQQPNMMQQMQMLGLMREIQQQNALRDVLQQSGGQIDDNTLAQLYARGNYQAANAIGGQRRQNMLADTNIQAKKLDMEATRLGMTQTGEQIQGVKLENRSRTVKADEAEQGSRATIDLLEHIRKNPNATSDEAMEGLRLRNPQAYLTLSKQKAEIEAAAAQARAGWITAGQLQTSLTRSVANTVSPLVPQIRDQETYSAVRDRIASLDPSFAAVIGADYTPKNKRALELFTQDLSDLEYKEDPSGRMMRINKRTGDTRPVQPVAPTPGPFGSTSLSEPALSPTADAATFDAAQRGGAAVPSYTPPGAVPAPRMDPKAEAAFSQAVARKAGEAAAKEKELEPQINAAIKELTAAAAPGGLISKSTGSGFGRQVDRAAGFVGVATPGAVAGGQLGPVADLALKIVPRFEGPQSDKDTQSYREAAGSLADTSVPVAIRQAAAKEVVRLLKKRSGATLVGEDTTPGKINNRAPNAQDEAALRWATANPNDPRAVEIKKMLGAP